MERPVARTAFERQADQRRDSTLTQIWSFLRDTKKWWLTPIVIALLLIGAFVLLGGTAAAPFIYTIF